MTGRRGKATLTWALALLALIGAACVGFFLYSYFTEKPRPTVVGWRSTVTTYAGDGAPGTADGAARTQARFADPFGVAVDREGNVYVADSGESNRVRKITPQECQTLAGGASEGYQDGAGASAAFDTPSGLAIDRGGNLYVADTGNNRIRKITPEGTVSTIAGDGVAGHADGVGVAARFNAPIGVAVDLNDNVYVADTYNDRIRRSRRRAIDDARRRREPGYADAPACSAVRHALPCR